MIAPQNVKLGLMLFLANFLISIPSAFLQIIYAPPELNRLVMAIWTFILFLMLGFIGYKLFRGSNLFRKINALLVIGGVILTVTGVTAVTHYHPAGIYLYWVGQVISICIVILFFTSSANIWFEIDHNVKA
jgi:O-antigen/teichoic acid export membrane protein